MSYINENDWKRGLNWKFPYRDHGLYGTLSDPKYVEDKRNIEKKHGNGWWWNDGRGWSMNWETHMLYQRRRKKEKGLE